MGESDTTEALKLQESHGAWPFKTRQHYRREDGSVEVRHSRHHRKGLPGQRSWVEIARELTSCLWMPREMNWWIGIIFSTGATIFAIGSLLFLFPALAASYEMDEDQINMVFFAGSIPFTTAAWLQLVQSANAGAFAKSQHSQSRRFRLFGWFPGDAGWLSCALQFVGTVLFNLNTFDALHPPGSWVLQDLEIWVPNILGSILFFASGYLAYIETCHAHWAWRPDLIDWWITFINLMGCAAFLISAAFAFVPPEAPGFDAVTYSLVFTLLGALAFLIGALLMLPEAAAGRSAGGTHQASEYIE